MQNVLNICKLKINVRKNQRFLNSFLQFQIPLILYMRFQVIKDVDVCLLGSNAVWTCE
jgi:hypothetical protein